MLTKVGWGVSVEVLVAVGVLVSVAVLVGVEVLVAVPTGVGDATTVGVEGKRVGVGFSSGPQAVTNMRVNKQRGKIRRGRITFMQ
jgi:hypothetical protein